ncbi:MAG: TadE/TadG family type IV pilus assembly protein [Novosphingobium sp.]
MQIYRKVYSDIGGVTAPTFAIMLPLLIVLVGGAVDISRMFWVKNRLQGACDAAVLAGRKSIATNGYDNAAKAVATTYFGTNFDQVAQGTQSTAFTSSATTSNNQVSGTASTILPMLFMRVFGWSASNIGVRCTSTMGVGNSDITMVLDVTGSMDSALGSSTRIASLRTAMKNFYTTVANAAAGGNARIRYGFVPYSSAVNVGQLLYAKNPDYLADTWPVQSREAIFDETTTIRYSGWSVSVPSRFIDYSSSSIGTASSYSSVDYDTQWECTAALPASSAWTDTGSPAISTSTVGNGNGTNYTKTTSAQNQYQRNYVCSPSNGAYYIYKYDVTRVNNTYTYNTSATITSTAVSQSFDHWEYKRVSFDVSAFKGFSSVSVNNGSSGAATSYTWAGCVEERETLPATSFTYSSISGMSPSSALDLDIDSAPNSEVATKWAPMWPQVAYYRQNSSGNMTNSPVTLDGSSAGNYCPTRSRLLATMTQSDFNAYADSLTANGATYLDIGMIWGARLSSPDGIFADNVSANPSNGGQVGRHIIFMTDGQMDTANYVLQSYGIEYHDRRTADDGTDGTSDSRHTQRFRAVCDAVKAKGIRIWVIAFTSSLSSDLSYCASSASSFTASSASALDTAFQTIAKQVGELRLDQ